jgi:hypothetical protein
MGNVIPWSQIHPSITSQEPFVAVVIIDPQRQICVSEMVPFDQEALGNADVAAPEVIAASQAAAAKVASGYRARRKEAPSRNLPSEGTPSLTVARKRGTEKLERAENPEGMEIRSGLRVLTGGKS